MKDHQSSLAAWNPIRPRLFLLCPAVAPLESPFLDLLDPEASFVGHYVRLALFNTFASLSLALFIRLLVGLLVPAGNVPLILTVTVWMAVLILQWAVVAAADEAFAVGDLYCGCITGSAVRHCPIYSALRGWLNKDLFRRRTAWVFEGRVSTDGFSLLPLLADVPCGDGDWLSCMAGPAYAPLLLVYVVYIALDLFYAYSRRQIKNRPPNQNLWRRSLLRVYHMWRRSIAIASSVMWLPAFSMPMAMASTTSGVKGKVA